MIICYTVPDILHVLDVIVFFPLWAIFSPFTPTSSPELFPLTAQKMKISKKWKRHLEVLSFNTSVPKILIICYIAPYMISHKLPKIMIICYTIPEIWCTTDIFIFDFGLCFALLPPNSEKYQTFKKMKKMPGYIIILHMCTKSYD